MTILDVLYHPHPSLREKASDVTDFDHNLRDLVQNMYETMEAYNGIGLAAPQIGILKRLFIVKFENFSQTFINPVLSEMKGSRQMNEGCLSLPNIQVPVERFYSLTITAQNMYGKSFKIDLDDMLATIVQHEFDHLNGVLIIDKNPPIAS